MALGVDCVRLRVFAGLPSVDVLGTDCCAAAVEVLAFGSIRKQSEGGYQKRPSQRCKVVFWAEQAAARFEGACRFQRAVACEHRGWVQAVNCTC